MLRGTFLLLMSPRDNREGLDLSREDLKAPRSVWKLLNLEIGGYYVPTSNPRSPGLIDTNASTYSSKVFCRSLHHHLLRRSL